MSTDEVVDVEVVAESLDAAEAVRETLPAVRAAEAMVARGEVTVAEVAEQREKIVAVMEQVMKPDVHYGRIPGVQKPTLLKPGAEVLAVTFRLAPFYKSERIFHDDGHLTVVSNVTLKHIPTGLTIAEGEGLCTSREKKYGRRKGERVCPECGEPQVRLGKARDGRPGNWYCWKKQGGCGATWPLTGEQADLFEAMDVGEIDNPDLADTWNTVLKMSNKRALVAAILNGTAASDVFTQDVEDMPAGEKRDAESRGSSGAAVSPKRKKQLDIEEMFKLADEKRGVDPGTTLNEARSVKNVPLIEMTEVDLDELGNRLGAFAYTVDPALMNERTFKHYYEDVPF